MKFVRARIQSARANRGLRAGAEIPTRIPAKKSPPVISSAASGAFAFTSVVSSYYLSPFSTSWFLIRVTRSCLISSQPLPFRLRSFSHSISRSLASHPFDYYLLNHSQISSSQEPECLGRICRCFGQLGRGKNRRN